jgi:hypothetical protein
MESNYVKLTSIGRRIDEISNDSMIKRKTKATEEEPKNSVSNDSKSLETDEIPALLLEQGYTFEAVERCTLFLLHNMIPLTMKNALTYLESNS